MTKLKVGDKVKIESAICELGRFEGKIGTIKVVVSDEEGYIEVSNGREYYYWLEYDTITLVNKVNKSVNLFKVGDKVYVARKHDYKQNTVDNYCSGFNHKIGMWGIVETVSECGGYMVKFEDGTSAGCYNENQLDKFIEAKYSLGEIFTWNKQEIEIVKVILNKKLKTYVYVFFGLTDGYFDIQTEEWVNAKLKKVVKEKVIEMTVEQISKALGKKVKVIK